MDHLVGDLEIRSFSRGLPEVIVTSLLEVGVKTSNSTLRQQIFQGVRELTRPGRVWGNKALSLSMSQIQNIGNLALEDSDAGDAAAELIGHFRAIPAIQVLLNHHDEDRKISALLLVQKTAGNLPQNVQSNIRFRLSLEWVLQQLIQQPVSLVGAYVMAFFGASLGVGIQVYLTANFPGYFDVDRFTVSMERGLITGAIFGLGIFLIRVIVERFHASNIIFRIILGTVLGSMGMNIALLIFHVLFVNTPPQGLLITSGCVVIAFAFVIGSLTRSYTFKALLSSTAIFMVIIATWWLHQNFAPTPVELTPVFRYDYAWSMIQVSFTALGVALPIGFLGNLVSLVIKDEL